MFLPLLIFGCVIYGVWAVASAITESRQWNLPPAEVPGSAPGMRHPAVKYLLGGLIPLGVGGTMTWLFLIAGGSPAAQFNAGASRQMRTWSLWVDLWPFLLWLAAAGGVASLVWLLIGVIRKKNRPGLPAAIASFVLSLLAFCSVLTYFPRA